MRIKVFLNDNYNKKINKWINYNCKKEDLFEEKKKLETFLFLVGLSSHEVNCFIVACADGSLCSQYFYLASTF